MRMLSASTFGGDLGVAEWAGIIGAVAAAVAALASLAAVLQNRRLIRASLLPHLAGVSISGRQHPELEIRNGGGGLAMAVRFIWVSEGHIAEGAAAATIRGGSDVLVAASLPTRNLTSSQGVLLCKDVRGDHYAWSLDGHDRVWRRRWWRRGKPSAPEARACFCEFYPGTRLSDLRLVEWTLPFKMSEGRASSSYPKTLPPDAPGETPAPN